MNQQKAKELLELMSGEEEKEDGWHRFVPLYLSLLALAIVITILVFVPVWLKVVIVVLLLIRAYTARSKIKAMFF